MCKVYFNGKKFGESVSLTNRSSVERLGHLQKMGLLFSVVAFGLLVGTKL